MKKGFDFISKDEPIFEKLIQIEKSNKFIFPKRFKEFTKKHSFSSTSLILEMSKDELRGFEFPAEAVLFKPSKEDENPLYFSYFRDLEDIAAELNTIQEDELWIDKGLIVIGYSTVGEKICLGAKARCADEIWRVNDDSIEEKKYNFLAKDIFEFINGLVSKKVNI